FEGLANTTVDVDDTMQFQFPRLPPMKVGCVQYASISMMLIYMFCSGNKTTLFLSSLCFVPCPAHQSPDMRTSFSFMPSTGA
ncbi:hypothetical protein PENTCL1PPCAC_10585, partial [Pristionchus entomophagus]